MNELGDLITISFILTSLFYYIYNVKEGKISRNILLISYIIISLIVIILMWNLFGTDVKMLLGK